MTATSVEVSSSDETRLTTLPDADLRAVIELRRRRRDEMESDYLRAKYSYEAAIDEAAHRRRMRSA